MSGSTLWVSPLGSDSNSGAEDSPLASINQAIRLAEPGTQILVKAGTYTENVTVSPGLNYKLNQLTESNNLEIISVDGPGEAIIRTADPARLEPTIFIVDVSHVVIDGFEVVSDVVSGDAGAVKIIGRNQGVEASVEQTTDITLKNNTFSGYGEFMVKGAMVEGVKIYNNSFEGGVDENLIDFTTVWESEIVGNDFLGSAWYAISMKTGSQYIRVADNYFDFDGSPTYGGKTAILVGGVGYSDLSRPPLPAEYADHEADWITITGNVIVSDTGSAITFQGGNNSVVEGNLLGATGGVAIHSTTSPSPQTGGSSGDNTITGNILMNVTKLNSYYTAADIAGTVFSNNVNGDLSDVDWAYGANATVSTDETTSSASQPGLLLKGTDGSDDLDGADGDDFASLGLGDDRTELAGGDDLAHGWRGRDALFGGKGNDVLNGHFDADRIEGGPGDDRITGGPGADTYVFKLGFDEDRIMDFRDYRDKLDFRLHSEVDSMADLKISQVGKHVVIRDGDGGRVVLAHTDISAIDASDFIF